MCIFAIIAVLDVLACCPDEGRHLPTRSDTDTDVSKVRHDPTKFLFRVHQTDPPHHQGVSAGQRASAVVVEYQPC
jgi:hypothetical protein